MALLRPSELARVWELHPRTVYSWIREGRLPAIKTPGAQYRVRTDDVREYCEKNGLPMPRAVARPAGTVAAIGKPSNVQRALARACRTRRTTFVAWPTALEGLLALAAEAPDVLAIDAACTEAKLVDVMRAIRKSPTLQKVPIVIYDLAPKATGHGRLGATAFFPRGKGEDAVRAAVEILDTSLVARATRRAD